ncbi:transporter substrate-binding domain-containing protein [Bradyrhizobium canariense]|uniref:Amino acid/amide ABC transporter substrate-binding protein, HAAT family n=1 Tax=Bradyrhizobium canariense TaxID=255045 RepID=A0A1H1UPJ3_9BRAD|nr:transporter substrate-binding domain-containing protein [Bradyrhizobium canariense]SDS74452.1 amino acid/amide ABC transporter substrate-binding protein, HAAT family [Bradyrhizobium canariense]
MALQDLQVGYLFSSTGSYELVARSMLNGALLAADQINASGLGVRFEPTVLNPGGDLSQYSALTARLLERNFRHVVGCYTSLSRKEVIPLFEKHDALLWYPSHYEGFESSTNVIYTGAAPNQHVLPLVEYLLTHHGHRAYCVGSNYIWAWENNRILRESVTARQGSVLAERYFALGETDFHQAIEAIIEARPSFVFLTLIGTSAYQFFREFRTACRARGIDQAREIPVASCSLSEPELQAIGEDAVDGHLSSSVYFCSIESAANRRFLDAYQVRFPDGPTASADAEASYNAAWLLARAAAAAGTGDPRAVKTELVRQPHLDAPQGEVWIDEQTFHAYLTPRIGRSNRNARFDLVSEARAPVRPDPYLVHNSSRFEAATAPSLRLVS